MGVERLIGLDKNDKVNIKNAIKDLPAFTKKIKEIDERMDKHDKDLEEIKKFVHTIFNLLILQTPEDKLNSPDISEAIKVIEDYL